MNISKYAVFLFFFVFKYARFSAPLDHGGWDDSPAHADVDTGFSQRLGGSHSHTDVESRVGALEGFWQEGAGEHNHLVRYTSVDILCRLYECVSSVSHHNPLLAGHSYHTHKPVTIALSDFLAVFLGHARKQGPGIW